MKLNSFDLIANGTGGIKISYIESVKSNNITHLDNVNRERPVPLPTQLRNEINELRIYFLKITGHWREAWDEAYDFEHHKLKDSSNLYGEASMVFDNTIITGVVKKGDGFLIKAKLYVLGRKVIAVNTPFVLMNDDEHLGCFDETQLLVNQILTRIADFITSKDIEMQNSRQYLLEIHKDEKNLERIEQQSEEECEEEAIKLLESRGKLVVDPKEGMEGLEKKEKESDDDEEDHHKEEESGIPATTEVEEEAA